MPPRVISRNLTNLFRRSGTEPLPGPKVSQDIALVSIVENLAHLVPPILNSSGVSIATTAAVAGQSSLLLVQSTSGFACTFSKIENTHPTSAVAALVTSVPPVLGVPAPVPSALRWGPLPTHVARVGAAAFAVSGMLIAAGQSWEAVPGNPIVVLPGQHLQVAGAVVNTPIQVQYSWEERVS